MHAFNHLSLARRRLGPGMFSSLLAALFLAAGFPVLAQDDALPFAKPGEDSAMIVGAIGKRAQYIYPVEFIEIDGKNIHPREVMWLEPGEYELTVRAFITNPPGLRSGVRSRSNEDNNRITVMVEAGKEYSIGVKYDASRPASPYNTVVYRVEEN